jgi:protein-disulfide isomerase
LKKFENLYKPKVDLTRPVRGARDASITIIEYTDLQCPYCAKAELVVKQIMERYQGKVRFLIKHFPLDFHPMALPAAIYFEALAAQNHDKAWALYDEILSNQRELNMGGEAFLRAIAQKLGADLNEIDRNRNSPAVLQQINEDSEEATRFEFSGTPGFLINGVPLRGAYPLENFVEIIQAWLNKLHN